MVRRQVANVRLGSLADPLTNISLMSAFPESGRSDRQKLGEIRVRFRPEADLHKCAEALANHSVPTWPTKIRSNAALQLTCRNACTLP